MENYLLLGAVSCHVGRNQTEVCTYAHTAGAGPRGDTHSAEPGERRTGEPSKGASSTPSTLQSPPLEQLNIMLANKREPFTETICILA